MRSAETGFRRFVADVYRPSPVITNLNEDLTVDHAAIHENVRYVVDRGIVCGSGVLLAVGAGGDFPMLSLDERKAVCKTIVEAAGGETPVLVRAQDTNPSVSIEMARWSEEIGADVVVVGAKGKNAFQGLLGSTGAKLVRRSPVPVLVLR